MCDVRSAIWDARIDFLSHISHRISHILAVLCLGFRISLLLIFSLPSVVSFCSEHYQQLHIMCSLIPLLHPDQLRVLLLLHFPESSLRPATRK